MSDLMLHPAVLSGEVAAPPSKSAAHRALICAALSGETARVSPVSRSADMEATLHVLAGMGFSFEIEGEDVSFYSRKTSDCNELHCKESGSTLRFLIPVAAALGLSVVFTGAGRLPERPLDDLLRELRAHGITAHALETGRQLPLSIAGQLRGGCFALPGNVSSQFISGLLLALPLLSEGGEVAVTGGLQSAGYVDLTVAALRQSGICVETTQTGWRIPAGQQYRGGHFSVEGDYSNAAFWLCAGAIAAPDGLTVTGLSASSLQGDRAVLPLLRQMGARLTQEGDTVTVWKSELHGCEIDASPIPDLIPVLAVTAAFAKGDTLFTNAARLRIKESDRIASTAAMVRSLGGQAEEFSDRLLVRGGMALSGGVADGFNDHRIVMSAAVGALGCTGAVTVRGAQAVQKSYPDFFRQYCRLGGRSVE